jgi:hypothetical protein
MIAAARATYQKVGMRPSAAAEIRARVLEHARRRQRRRAIRRLLVALITIALLGLLATIAAQAQETTPTPTLAPVISDSTSATQTLQLQELLRELVYQNPPTTISGTVTTTLAADTITMTAQSDATWLSTVITKTTSSGANWTLERRFTWGDAAVVVVAMAVILIQVFGLVIRVGLDR